MAAPTLYKYRSLSNWMPILDIVANQRLFAAPFGSLNDPMEGRYHYFGDAVTAGLRKAILKSKMRRNICSLSAARNNTLLWSYYANGHTGLAFAIQLKEDGQRPLEAFPIRYDSGVHIGPEEARNSADNLAVSVLTQKQLAWAHEQEVRVFSPTSYVAVKLKEVLLGCKMSEADEELLTTVVRKWHPKIKITRVDPSTLDEPDAVTIANQAR